MRARPGESAWSLVFFTVLAQAAAGVSVAAALVPDRLLTLIALVALGVGALAATLHLGRIRNGRFTLSNLGSSWLSREGLLAGAFGLALAVAAVSPDTRPASLLAALLGVAMVGAISMVYMIRTVSSWNTWMTPVSFFLTATGLGAALSVKVIPDTWNGIGLHHVAAVAAGAQVLLGLLRKWRFGTPNSQWFATIVGVMAVGVLLGLPLRGHPSGAAVLLLAELMHRQAFYESHRRVGL